MKFWFFLVFIFSHFCFSAPHNLNRSTQMMTHLSASHFEAVSQFKKMGIKSLSQLDAVAFDAKQSMSVRWKSLMVLAEVFEKKGLVSIKKALNSPVWYMRSAGLTAMEQVDRGAAKKWAYRKLSQDPALMVRLKALEILQKSPDEKIISLYWQKLYSADSYHLSKGLLIRKNLAQQLLKTAQKKDLKKWVRLLHEEEASMQSIAVRALAKLNSEQSENSKKTSYWQRRYPSKKM